MEKKSTTARESMIRAMPAEWGQQMFRATTEKIAAIHVGAADLIIGFVRNYNLGGEEEIRPLLESVIAYAVGAASHCAEARGRELERTENPAIKSLGAAVAVARRKDREATRAILDEVFQREAERGNPFYAFNEALKAIE